MSHKFYRCNTTLKYFLLKNIRDLTPVIIVPKEQGWYYSTEWQEKEKKVDQQIKEGKFRVAESTEELFKDLGLDKS